MINSDKYELVHQPGEKMLDQSEYESIYQVLTPAGVFQAVFGEEDTPVEYRGNETAIQFFKNWLALNQISGEHGILLNDNNLEPDQLYGFCQPDGSGITVLPPLDDLLMYAQQEAMEQDEKPTQTALDGATQEENPMHTAILDAVSGIEKLNLVKEVRGIRETLLSVKSGIEKLNLVKRIKEIRVVLGVNGSSEGGLFEDNNIKDVSKMSKQEIEEEFKRQTGHTPFSAGSVLGGVEMRNTWRENGKLNDPVEESPFNAEQMAMLEAWQGFGKKSPYLFHTTRADNLYSIKEKGLIPNAPRRQSGVTGDGKLSLAANEQAAKYYGDSGDIMLRVKKSHVFKDLEADLLSGDGTYTTSSTIPTSALDIKLGSKWVSLDTLSSDELSAIAGNHPESLTKPQATIADVNAVMPLLKQFIGQAQLSAMGSGIRGEEGQFFKDKFIEVSKVIQTMPETYGTDGQGDKAVAYLHYFKGGMDWYITEKDAGDAEDEKEGISGQVQAYGYANLGDPQNAEMGYISIKELIEAGVELDLYWTPKSIGTIKGKDEDEKPVIEQSSASVSSIGKALLYEMGGDWTSPDVGGYVFERNGVKVEASGKNHAKDGRQEDAGYFLLSVWDGNAWVPPPSELGSKSISFFSTDDPRAIADKIHAEAIRIVTEYAAYIDNSGAGIDEYTSMASSLVQQISQYEYQQGIELLTEYNEHTEALVFSAKRTGVDSLIDRAEAMLREQNKSPDGVTMEFTSRRFELQQEINKHLSGNTAGTEQNPMKSAFEAELEALKQETDIEAFDKRLDDIAGRIEQAGLMEELDAKLNQAADILTGLLAEAEKG
jgi:hypothetical protein